MKINDIFGLPEVAFIEPAFNVLPDEAFTSMLINDPSDEARLVADEEDWPLAIALHTQKGWRATNFILRPPVIEVVERFEQIGGEVVSTTQEDWMRATREYYSFDLLRTIAPAMEDHSEERATKVKGLLGDIWGDRKGEVCLDCGCGSGMGAAMLREVGINALAYDNDPTLLSLGLSKGRLLPEETMWVDAALIGHYVRPTALGLALMAGSVSDFTALIWKSILHELMDVTEETLVTVETKKEAGLVKMWALGEGKKVDLFENDRDQFYDRWVCLMRE